MFASKSISKPVIPTTELLWPGLTILATALASCIDTDGNGGGEKPVPPTESVCDPTYGGYPDSWFFSTARQLEGSCAEGRSR